MIFLKIFRETESVNIYASVYGNEWSLAEYITYFPVILFAPIQIGLEQEVFGVHITCMYFFRFVLFYSILFSFFAAFRLYVRFFFPISNVFLSSSRTTQFHFPAFFTHYSPGGRKKPHSPYINIFRVNFSINIFKNNVIHSAHTFLRIHTHSDLTWFWINVHTYCPS